MERYSKSGDRPIRLVISQKTKKISFENFVFIFALHFTSIKNVVMRKA